MLTVNANVEVTSREIGGGAIARPHLRPLTSLRFFAALLVLGFHTGSEILPNAPWWLANFFANGYNAVSFFFVLSGFVLAYVYGGGSGTGILPGGILAFWRARFARIYPAYFVALLIALPAFFYSMAVSKMVSLHDFIAGLILVPTLLQAWWPPSSTTWNIPAWSLSVEGSFYLAFPILLRLVITTRIPKLFFLSMLAVVVVSITRDWLRMAPDMILGADIRTKFINYFPLWFLPHFVFGMALSRIFSDRDSRLAMIIGRLAFPAAIALFPLFFFRSRLPAWILSDAVLIPLFGAVIFGTAQAKGWMGAVLSCKPLVQLGEASYALYILHMPLVFWFQWIALRFGLRPLEHWTGVILFVGSPGTELEFAL